MPRNSSGTCTNPLGPFIAGDDILATEVNSVNSDVYSVLTDSLSRSGKGGLTANLDANGFKIANLGAANANGQAVRYDEFISNDALSVHLAGAETITGVKTFSAHPLGLDAANIASTATGNISATNVQAAIAELESETLHKATAETVSGVKTFQSGSEPVAKNICKAWCVFDGTLTGTNAPLQGFNITNVTRNGVGDYTLTIAGSVLTNANYAATGSANFSNGIAWVAVPKSGTTPTTTELRVAVANADAFADLSRVSIQIFGV